MDTARVIDHLGAKPEPLTRQQCEALRRDSDYEWVIDGLADPPKVFRSGHKPVALRRAEFDVLAKLVCSPRVGFSPKQLFPGASYRTAQKRYNDARKKVEPSGPTERRAFCSVGRGEEDLRYKFEPTEGLRYCLIAKAEVKATPLPVLIEPHQHVVPLIAKAEGQATPRPGALGSAPWPDHWAALTTLIAARSSTPPPKSGPQKPRLMLKETDAVDGILVRLGPHKIGSELRVRVALVNQTRQLKIIESMTLKVAGQTWKAFVPRLPPRTRRLGSSRGPAAVLDPWMIRLPPGDVVTGVLAFPVPDSEGDAIIQPDVLRRPMQGRGRTAR